MAADFQMHKLIEVKFSILLFFRSKLSVLLPEAFALP